MDAAFTSVSAVCVTGLIVLDTPNAFSGFGQLVLVLLIQVGGLGIMAFYTVALRALGRRLSLRHEVTVAGALSVEQEGKLFGAVARVLAVTFVSEALGVLLLLLAFVNAGEGFRSALWRAVFTSVSAFCNAGFSTFSDSLSGYQRSPLVQLVIMLLIVLGGIGFLTMEELAVLRKARLQKRRFRLSLHSRIVLVTTGSLILGGWVLFTAFEWHVSFAGMPAWAKFVNGLFASVTARTAGFNTIDYSTASDSTNFLTILLMFIGGSPGSTAGGIKTTTFALIGLFAIQRYRGYNVTSLWGRSIPDETMQRAVGLVAVAFGLVTAAIFVFTTTEQGTVAHNEVPEEFLKYMFEAASAFNTVGLSMGVTDSLTGLGRITTVLLMFIGRVGPLTFAASLARRWREPIGGMRYSYEDVVIG